MRLDPLRIQTVAVEALGRFVTPLADDDAGPRIINALDGVICRVSG